MVGRNVSLVALSLAAVSVLHSQQRTPAVDAFAQVQALNAELLSSGSATKNNDRQAAALFQSRRLQA